MLGWLVSVGWSVAKYKGVHVGLTRTIIRRVYHARLPQLQDL